MNRNQCNNNDLNPIGSFDIPKLMPKTPFDINYNPYPKIKKFNSESVFIVMEKIGEIIDLNVKPLSVHDNYNDAKNESLKKINSYVVGPIPYIKSSNMSLIL